MVKEVSKTQLLASRNCRVFTPAQSCEAARRALLSQGYIVVNASTDLIDGKKSFQPGPEAHLEMMIRVVCVPENVFTIF